jgi:hypothetical protein
MGRNTEKTAITIVNNASTPVRDIYLNIPVKQTENHAAISPSSAVVLGDLQPCLQETYSLIVSLKANPNEDFGSSSFWYVYFAIDGQYWKVSLQNGELSRTSEDFVAATKRPGPLYGIGGISYLRGFLAESSTETPSDGPGCG